MFSAQFTSARYINLTTFRRDGRAVSTPVWFAIEGDHLVLWTAASSGKAKRLRHTKRVTVAPCDLRGRVKGPTVAARARLLPASDGSRIERLLNQRYALTKRLYGVAMGLWQRFIVRRPPGLAAYIEISAREE
ncbi:MAG: PPOX class F420-dependent oxidoreductase [Chloroflexota bacterium]|nr:PPOX class F420-dependent oxidoreductase [Chloroflexota bacterium]